MIAFGLISAELAQTSWVLDFFWTLHWSICIYFSLYLQVPLKMLFPIFDINLTKLRWKVSPFPNKISLSMDLSTSILVFSDFCIKSLSLCLRWFQLQIFLWTAYCVAFVIWNEPKETSCNSRATKKSKLKGTTVSLYFNFPLFYIYSHGFLILIIYLKSWSGKKFWALSL